MLQPDQYVKVERTLTDEEMAASFAAQDNPDTTTKNTYLCEVCDKQEELTEAEAYQAGWDYPPFIGMWGVVSPRTCPTCTIEGTAYWAILRGDTLSDKHEATIKRILAERIEVRK